MTEAAILRSTLQILTARGVFCWRNNSGVTVLGAGKSRRIIRGAPAGSPDILGVLGTSGKLFGIELKTATGRVSTSQKLWSERAQKFGVLYGVARSPREAMALIAGWAK
jgi:hypothetical protein